VRFDGGRQAVLDVTLDADRCGSTSTGIRRVPAAGAGRGAPSLGTLFGAKRQVLVMRGRRVPRSSRPGASSASSGGRYRGVEVVDDGALTELPRMRPCGSGWDNRFAMPAARASGGPAESGHGHGSDW